MFKTIQVDKINQFLTLSKPFEDLISEGRLAWKEPLAPLGCFFPQVFHLYEDKSKTSLGSMEEIFHLYR